jgi:hypothetical protein
VLHATIRKGVTAVGHPATGRYCLTLAAGIDPTTTRPAVSIDSVGAASATAAEFSSTGSNCPAGQLEVDTFALLDSGRGTSPITQSAANAGFFFIVP